MTSNRSVFKSAAATAISALLGVSFVLGFTGCGEGPTKPDHIPDLTPLTITVTYNSQPVPDASVLLAPSSAGQFSAAGITDRAGRAVMRTDALYDGVVPGEYRASVTKVARPDVGVVETPDDPAEYEKQFKAFQAEADEPQHLIPERYASFGSSELTVTVVDGTPADLTFELTD